MVKKAGANRDNQANIAPTMPSIMAPQYADKLKRGPGKADTMEKPYQNCSSDIKFKF